MKKIALILLPIFAFAFDVNFNKEFKKEIMPDTLSAQIVIMINDESEKDVSKRLVVFNEKIKSFDKVEKKLGTFNIRPKYKYSSNTPTVVGYVGVLRYEVNSNKALYMDKLISDITELKDNRDTSVSVNQLSWKVKDDTYNVALDILRLDAITWAENYSNTLSQDINKKCEIKSINISHSIQPVYRMQRAEMSLSSTSAKKDIPIPDISNQKILINPQYTMECK